MSDISIYDWIFGFLMALSFLFGFLSIPSLIAIKKLGFRNYINDIKILISLYGKIGDCYCITKTRTYNIGHSGRTFQDTVTNFFYPIYKDKDTLYVINSRSGFFEKLDISEHKYGINKWENTYFQMSTSTCLFRQLLLDRFKNKLAKFAKNSTAISDSQLNELLNSQATSNRREYILNEILNG